MIKLDNFSFPIFSNKFYTRHNHHPKLIGQAETVNWYVLLKKFTKLKSE
jgi:hypothetical protein